MQIGKNGSGLGCFISQKNLLTDWKIKGIMELQNVKCKYRLRGKCNRKVYLWNRGDGT